MILQPQVDFPISRQIANHLDVATYYVQAKVYDADGALISTVNLADKGSQRFTKRWRTPVDKSGEGTYVSIVTSVYTDDAYTTKSSNYGDEENTYLIFNRVRQAGGGGSSAGAGGGNVSLSEIKRIVQEVIEDNKPEEVEEKEINIPDYTDNLAQLDRNFEMIAGMISELPKEKVDLQPVFEGIQNLANAIEAKPVTPETDLEPVLDEITSMSNLLENRLDDHAEMIETANADVIENIKATFDEGVSRTDQMKSVLTNLKKVIDDGVNEGMGVNDIKPAKPAPETPQKALDMRQLVR